MAPTELDLTLYLVTDSSLLPPNTTLADHVRASIKGGVTIVQLREKNLQTAAFIKLGKQIHAITRELGVPLLINDRVDVAMAVGCEGVHIGWEDMDYKTARDLLGPDAIIGLSVSNRDQLALALEAGPTYLGLGPVYATATKPDHGIPLRISGLCSLLEEIPAHIPTVAIGGISHAKLERVLLSTSQSTPSKHLDGVAIASAIITSTEPEKTCLELQKLMKHLRLMLGNSSDRSQPIADLVPELVQILKDSRKHPPLVHHITNSVSSTLSANVTLAIGASPIMSENPAEFEDLAVLNNGRVALVLNMGTFPDETKTKSMFLKALAAHNKFSNPVVFDPVGCGATVARSRFARAILEAGQCDVIKGNEGEILSIAGEKVNMRGVDGAGLDGGIKRERELAKVCSELAKSEASIIVMTGPTDIVSNGQITYLLRNGDPIQTRVTGIGCVLSSVIAAALVCATSDGKIAAVIAAVSAFNIAAEKANAAPKPAGPASWAVRFLDALATSPEDGFEGYVKIEKIRV